MYTNRNKFPLLTAIRKLAFYESQFDVPVWSGFNRLLTNPDIPIVSDSETKPGDSTVESLAKAFKSRGSSSSKSQSKIKGPQATTMISQDNLTKYHPTIMGVRQS